MWGIGPPQARGYGGCPNTIIIAERGWRSGVGGPPQARGCGGWPPPCAYTHNQTVPIVLVLMRFLYGAAVGGRRVRGQAARILIHSLVSVRIQLKLKLICFKFEFKLLNVLKVYINFSLNFKLMHNIFEIENQNSK